MSSATLTAIAVLESPRYFDGKPKSLIFDAQIYLGPENALVAGLRYFNTNSYSFDDVSYCLIIANVVKYVDPLHELLKSDLDSQDYDLFGDIINLIPLSKDIDVRHLPFMHVSATSTHSLDSEFNMDPNVRLANVPANIAATLTFPMVGIIPDNARWQNRRKPVPSVNSIASINGWLSATRGRSETTPAERFVVIVENVAFLGRAQVPVATPDTPTKTTPKKLKFNFSDVGGSPSKRRRTADDDE